MLSPFDPPSERHFFETIAQNPYFAPTPRGPRGLKKKDPWIECLNYMYISNRKILA